MSSMPLSRRSLLGLAGGALGAAALGACGDDAGGGDGEVTITWWHISNTDPMLSVWATAAKEYEAANPGVTIKITPLENEAFKAKLTTVTQAGNPPDLFSTWGGGVLAQQVEAGLVRDLTADVSSWIGDLSEVPMEYYKVDGRQYGIPFDNGMVGFWYNKDLFARARIAAPPATWAEFLDGVDRLKAAGITPIALGGREKWPAHFYFSYLALRIGGPDALESAMAAKDFDRPDLVEAGRRFRELVDREPFQRGYISATYPNPDGQAAAVGNGQAAMELMGQWAPATQAAYSRDGKGLGDKVGFFRFPEVEGGKGRITDVFGGGNGFAVGRDAPPQTVDLLRFLLTAQVQRRGAAKNGIVPVTSGAEDAITDPNQAEVARTVAAATAFQLYLDQAWAPAVGAQVNDSVTALLAGKVTPEEAVRAITTVARR